MKFKKIMLVSILLLAIFTIGAVSAAEDEGTVATEDVTEESLSSPVDEVELESTDEADCLFVSEDDIEIDDFPEEVKYAESLKFNITVHDANNNDGHVEGYLDDHDFEDYWDYYSANESFPVSIGQYLSFGTHKLSLRFVDGDGNYDITKVLTFNVTDYEIGICDGGTNPVFGDDYSLEFSLPPIAGELIVNINNKEYKKSFCEFDSHYIEFQAADIRYGINNLNITFNPEESKYKSKTAQATINCTAEIKFNHVTDEYGNVGNITLVLPSNATGNLTVTLNGNQIANIPLVDGKALFDFSVVAPGEYAIEAAYTGDDYEAVYTGNNLFNVIPNVKIPDYVYTGYEYFNITITLPDTLGKLVITNEDDESTIYSNNSACGVITVSLPVDSRITNLHVNYTLGDYNCEKTFYVEYSDVDLNFELLFEVYESSVLKGDYYYASWDGDYWFTPELTGKFIIYLDNVIFDTWNDVNDLSINTENLTVGEHTWKVEFVGDEYYLPNSLNCSFNVIYINIDIPEEVTYDSDYISSNSIHVYMPDNATGIVVVYVDNKEFKTEFISSGFAHISLTDLTLGKHNVEVKYSGNYPAYSKKGNVTSDYIFYVYTDYDNSGSPYWYGETINVYVRLSKANATVNVEFGGKTYPVKVENGFGSIKLPTLPEGTYEVMASFAGDSTFPAKTDSCTFEVDGYVILYPYIIDYGSDENITLTLPKNATGNLSVIINNNTFANVPLNNGIAVISLKNLTYGHHTLKIMYTGDDYTVCEVSDEIYVIVNWEADTYPYLSEDGHLYIEIPKDATGKVILTIDDVDEIPLTPDANGIINYTFPKLKLGSHTFKLTYNGTDYGMIFESWGNEFDYFVDLDLNVDEDGVSLTLPEDANGKLTILYAKGGYEPDKVLFDENVTGPNVKIPFTGLKPGSYDLFVGYVDDKYGAINKYPSAYVSKSTPEITISTSGDVKKTVITFAIENATGSLIVKIDDGASQFVSMDNGVGSLTVENIASGSHALTVSYSGDSNFDPFTVEKTFDVGKSNSESIIPPRIVAGNAAVYYSAGTIYKVTVYAKGGKLAANTLVVVKINGKKVATVRTNANGVATYKLVQNPGNYKITTEAAGASVTRTLSVKHVVVLRAAVVKKSAKKLLLQATVKIGKKAVANKWVVFKFNGRVIKAKTNKLGVAKVIIKKPILNRLKVGKNVVYQASYLKDTVKKVAKIYR